MSCHFSGTVLLRLPLYPLNKFGENPEQALQDPVFRAALFTASPMFYQRLVAADFSWDKLSLKEQATLLKYDNRCCFRPTPFGLFASVSCIRWGQCTNIQVSGSQFTAHVQADQSFVQAAAAALSGLGKFEPNPTLYRVMKDYRFISTEITNDGKRTYQLQSTDFSVLLKGLFDYCRPGRSASEIIRHIGVLACTGLADSHDYFLFLCDAQVLIPVLRTRLTGNHYLAGLAAQKNKSNNADYSSHKAYFGRELNEDSITVAGLEKFQEGLRKDFHEVPYGKDMALVTLFRSLPGATLDVAYQHHIRQGLFALGRLAAPNTPAMVNFARSFRRHFDEQRIPLLQALDPEAGIGYAMPANDSSSPLLETIRLAPKHSGGDSEEWTPIHSYLMQSWINAEREGSAVISLEEEDLLKLKSKNDSQSHGISVLFRAVRDKVYIERAGGNNLLALAGRFTANDASIHRAMKEISSAIEAQNPDIIFAEILHLSDPHIDNVNLRQTLWSYELPLTAAPSLPPEQQVQLADLYVVVDSEQVFLWSDKHQKYIVPRLTTAYNHHLNQLPLFRFLADLPYQYGQSNFSFNLPDLFPGLSYYPRVEYKNAIISPATWVLDGHSLSGLLQAAEPEIMTVFQKLAAKISLPVLFMLSEGDQQLVFNAESSRDVRHFREVVHNREQLTLMEFIHGQDATITKDEHGNPFVAQFNCFLLPDKGLAMPPIRRGYKLGQAKRKFMPGTEWLYLKLYVPKRNANKLLLLIAPLLHKTHHGATIRKWFFVRYEDHAPHIRLRLQIDPQDLNVILFAFRSRLEGHIQQQLIREYQLEVYTRELERYRMAGMEFTENLFCASSNFVMRFLQLQKQKKAPPVYLAAVVSVKLIANALLPDEASHQDLFRQYYQKMAEEFDGKNAKYQLDLKYRALGAEILQAIQDPRYLERHGMAKAGRELMTEAAKLYRLRKAPGPETTAYLHSVLHMHLNRLFSEEGRLQETIVYYLLFKYLTAAEGRKKYPIR